MHPAIGRRMELIRLRRARRSGAPCGPKGRASASAQCPTGVIWLRRSGSVLFAADNQMQGQQHPQRWPLLPHHPCGLPRSWAIKQKKTTPRKGASYWNCQQVRCVTKLLGRPRCLTYRESHQALSTTTQSKTNESKAKKSERARLWHWKVFPHQSSSHTASRIRRTWPDHRVRI